MPTSATERAFAHPALSAIAPVTSTHRLLRLGAQRLCPSCRLAMPAKITGPHNAPFLATATGKSAAGQDNVYGTTRHPMQAVFASPEQAANIAKSHPAFRHATATRLATCTPASAAARPGGPRLSQGAIVEIALVSAPRTCAARACPRLRRVRSASATAAGRRRYRELARSSNAL